MRNLAQEISEDYYLEDDEEDIMNAAAIDGAFGDDVDMLNSDIKAVTDLEEEISQLQDTAIAIERFGINPTSFLIMRSKGFLDGTSLNSIAVESIGQESYNSENSVLALEALTDKIKEKSAQWSAKVLGAIANGTKKIMDVLTPIWNVIQEKTKALASASWDKTKEVGATIKAHPYATIIAILAAAAAVAGIVAYSGGNFPSFGTTNEAMQKFMSGVGNKLKAIKIPGGKITTTAIVDGRVVIAQVDTAEQIAKRAASPNALGWTVNTVKSVFSQISRVWKMISGAISTVWNRLYTPIKKLFGVGDILGNKVRDKVLDKTGSKIMGWTSKQITAFVYSSIVFKFLTSLFSLIKKIVVGAFRMVSDTFKALSIVFV